jgi:hypothetical protein
MAKEDSSFLGPSYDYWKNIKQPSQMGMSSEGSLDALATNVDGLLSYVQVLVTGGGNASKTGKPLGNKFFLKTKGKCREMTIENWKKEQEEDKKWNSEYEQVEKDLKNKSISEDAATKKKNALSALKDKRDKEREKAHNKIVDRWIYVNNIPDGTIPFISSGADGSSFSDLRGLIPGAMGNLAALNPAPLFKAFVTGSTPDCAKISLESVDETNAKMTESRHLALMDVEVMNPCYFSNGSNPISGSTCQGFTTVTAASANNKTNNKNAANTNGNTSAGSGSGSGEMMLVSEDGETIGLYETGSLAGSSGLAYQTTQRSPLSYNIANNKATMTSGLEYASFDFPNKNGKASETETSSSKGIIDKHNAASSSFFKSAINDNEYRDEGVEGVEGAAPPSMYDTLMANLSKIIDPAHGSDDKPTRDLSKINGGIHVEVYYASISFLLLYFIYKMNYKPSK